MPKLVSKPVAQPSSRPFSTTLGPSHRNASVDRYGDVGPRRPEPPPPWAAPEPFAGHATHHARVDHDKTEDNRVPAPSSLLQPRVAVLLGVPAAWHPPLFACRLLSIAPAVWWGLPSVVRFLVQLRLLSTRGLDGLAGGVHFDGPALAAAVASVCGGSPNLFEGRLRIAETGLAVMWCSASAYLSFFFTDCLMSRWLVNYTPHATLVRLLAIDATNFYLTSRVLALLDGFKHPRMVFPSWIAIATILTAIYHVTYRKINIRKETSISISVFSLASFTSMSVLVLLILLHSIRPDTTEIPLVIYSNKMWALLEKLFVMVLEYVNVADEL